MKVFTNIVKVLVALAAVAGAVYAVATYGDKLVAWAKKLLNGCPCTCDCDCDCACDCDCEEVEAPVEQPVAEEAPAQEAPMEEPAVEEAPADDAPVADEADFEG